MKAKSSKQSKGQKANVQINDLQPTKDSKGQGPRGREMGGLQLDARMAIVRPGILRG